MVEGASSLVLQGKSGWMWTEKPRTECQYWIEDHHVISTVESNTHDKTDNQLEAANRKAIKQPNRYLLIKSEGWRLQEFWQAQVTDPKHFLKRTR